MVDPAIVGVIGTLAGTALGGGLAYVADRARWRAALHTRWDERRQDLYAELLKSVRAISQYAPDDPGHKPLSAEIERLLAHVLLLSTSEVFAQATKLSVAAGGPDVKYAASSGPLEAAEWNFLAAAREELRVPLHVEDTPPEIVSGETRSMRLG
jgi:hypothetical protein